MEGPPYSSALAAIGGAVKEGPQGSPSLSPLYPRAQLLSVVPRLTDP